MEIDATTTDAATATVGTDGSSGAHERPYGIVLDVFEGPLDLLLYLIRKNEVDIYDIPISTITAQYLAVINGQLRLPDIEVASGFILVAATLMKIKSQILLPREVEPGMEDVEGDPVDAYDAYFDRFLQGDIRAFRLCNIAEKALGLPKSY